MNWGGEEDNSSAECNTVKIESIKDGKQHWNNKDILPVHDKVWWKIKGERDSVKKGYLKTKWGYRENFCRSWSERLENMGGKSKWEVCEVI